MYVKDLFCRTCIVLIQLCGEDHASCTLKTSFVVRALFLPITQLCEEGHASCTTKEVFSVHDA
jgi:hypothetical protein